MFVITKAPYWLKNASKFSAIQSRQETTCNITCIKCRPSNGLLQRYSIKIGDTLGEHKINKKLTLKQLLINHVGQ